MEAVNMDAYNFTLPILFVATIGFFVYSVQKTETSVKKTVEEELGFVITSERDETKTVTTSFPNGSITYYPLQKTPAQILIRDAHSVLWACNYQMWFFGGTALTSTQNHYVADAQINPTQLTFMRNFLFENKANKKKEVEELHEFIRNLMESPPDKAKFVQFIKKEERENSYVYNFALYQ